MRHKSLLPLIPFYCLGMLTGPTGMGSEKSRPTQNEVENPSEFDIGQLEKILVSSVTAWRGRRNF